MGWGIDVKTVGDLPAVDESISSVCSCPGNFYTAVRELQEDQTQLRDMTREEAIAALKLVIKEVDKGNDGKFNDSYCVAADEQWSKGRESRESWEKAQDLVTHMKRVKGANEIMKYNPQFGSYQAYTGYETRDRIRVDALRFMLYYIAGYDITFTW